jgi:hypothetical protein
MGCLYEQDLIAEFGGHWEPSHDQLGVHMDRLGFTYWFNAVSRHLEIGVAATVAASFLTAVEYLSDAA